MDEELIGVEEQEEAEPAVEQETAEGNEPQQEPVREPQTQEIPNSVWAAARHRAEAEAKQKYDRMFAEQFGNFTNPQTGTPIQGVEDYLAAIKSQQETRAREMRDSAIEQAARGMDPQAAAAFRNAMNAYQQQTEQELRTLRNAQEAQQRQYLQQQEEQNILNHDIPEIGKINPAIKDMQSLMNDAAGAAAVQACMKVPGLNLVDAYKAAAFDTMMGTKADGARQAAINQMRGKEHLSPMGKGAGRPSGGVDIPANMLETWKAMFPNDTPEKLRKRYNDAQI